jgi:hypothetical protein
LWTPINFFPNFLARTNMNFARWYHIDVVSQDISPKFRITHPSNMRVRLPETTGSHSITGGPGATSAARASGRLTHELGLCNHHVSCAPIQGDLVFSVRLGARHQRSSTGTDGRKSLASCIAGRTIEPRPAESRTYVRYGAPPLSRSLSSLRSDPTNV